MNLENPQVESERYFSCGLSHPLGRNLSSMADRLEGWFKTEVFIHEGILMRFLARVWPRRDDLTDLRQEIYIRVYEAALEARPQSPKAFLFSIARHVLIDRRRRERIVSIQSAGDNDFSNDLIEERTPERLMGARQEFARLAAAFDRLPPKCREVIWLRRIQQLPQRQIAQRLGISEKTVEYHISMGGRLLALYIRGAEPEPGDTPDYAPAIETRIYKDEKDEEHW